MQNKSNHITSEETKLQQQISNDQTGIKIRIQSFQRYWKLSFSYIFLYNQIASDK